MGSLWRQPSCSISRRTGAIWFSGVSPSNLCGSLDGRDGAETSSNVTYPVCACFCMWCWCSWCSNLLAASAPIRRCHNLLLWLCAFACTRWKPSHFLHTQSLHEHVSCIGIDIGPFEWILIINFISSAMLALYRFSVDYIKTHTIHMDVLVAIHSIVWSLAVVGWCQWILLGMDGGWRSTFAYYE